MLRLANATTRLIASGSAPNLNRLLIRPVSQFQVPKPTLSQWVWYRKDGTPRSKKRGLIRGGVTAVSLSLLFSTIGLLQILITAEHVQCEHLLFYIQLQRLDYEFASKPMSDMDIAFNYWEELIRPLSKGRLDHVPKGFSYMYATSREAIHQLVQGFYEDIHAILQKSAGNERKAASASWRIMKEMLQNVYGVMIKDTVMRQEEKRALLAHLEKLNGVLDDDDGPEVIAG
ncbi:hypothetical protein C8J56DRAFT_939259 [Mycena floridula]|nr:hypothetical protein C8J56DRAFT_939259 [Mycena floridula]